MRKFLYLSVLIFTLINCKKEDNDINPPDFIIAGDSSRYQLFNNDYSIDGLDNGDSVPSVYSFSSYDYLNLPIYFNNIEDAEISYGCANFLVNNYLILRNYFVTNNYKNTQKFEFALNSEDVFGMRGDTIRIVKLFNINDTINKNQRWAQFLNPEYPNVFFISYYYDYESNNKLIFPSDSDPIIGNNIFINRTVENYYIGIRKRVNNIYVYGFIKFSIKDYDQFKLLGYAFADK